MRRIRVLIASILVSLLTVAGASAFAADLRGEYVFDAAASDDVKQVVERTVASMNFITRPIARSRLNKGTKASPTLALAYDEREIVVTFEPKNPVRMPVTGTVVSWTREDGETFKVQGQWEGEALRQVFKASDGDRINVFRLDPAGERLIMEVTLASPQLPMPVKYKLVYRRR